MMHQPFSASLRLFIFDSRRHWRLLGLLAVALLLLAACGRNDDGTGASFDAISFGEFPDTVGRGFPTAEVPARSGQATVGEPAPNFALVLDSGEGAELADLQGSPVVINFWASWCGPCRAEMPDLVALHQANNDVVVLAVNVQENLELAQPFAEAFDMTMPVVLDQDGEVMRSYGVRGLPATIFVDSAGTVVSRWDGVLTADLLEERVAELH